MHIHFAQDNNIRGKGKTKNVTKMMVGGDAHEGSGEPPPDIMKGVVSGHM